MFDLGQWLSPLDGANPSGDSLRNDQRFHDLERLMQPRIEVTRNERNMPVSQTAIPVDWAEVLRKAEELRGSGRDLRLLVIVVRALANIRGLAGLADGLTLIARTFEEHWETMHPELRAGASPRDAALRRINALLQLEKADDGLLGDLRATALLTPRGLGPLYGRDLERGTLDARTVVEETAKGLGEAERAAIADEHERLLGRVNAGCAAEADQAADAYAALRDGAHAAAEALEAMEAALNARLGNGVGVALPVLRRFLERTAATLDRAAAPAGQAAGAAPEPAADADAAAPPAAAPGAAAPPAAAAGAPAAAAPGAFPDRLGSRDEVVRCLDLIIGFYDRTEPASPIPHLARRIRRMVPMDFLELMEDLAPSGLKEFRQLAGVSDSRKSPQKDER